MLDYFSITRSAATFECSLLALLLSLSSDTANVAARAAAAESGRDGHKTVKADTFTGMSLEVCL